MEIRFVTKNPHKAREVETILGDIGVSIVDVPLKIYQTEESLTRIPEEVRLRLQLTMAPCPLSIYNLTILC